jgi:hypothetical protein
VERDSDGGQWNDRTEQHREQQPRFHSGSETDVSEQLWVREPNPVYVKRLISRSRGVEDRLRVCRARRGTVRDDDSYEFASPSGAYPRCPKESVMVVPVDPRLDCYPNG